MGTTVNPVGIISMQYARPFTAEHFPLFERMKAQGFDFVELLVPEPGEIEQVALSLLSPGVIDPVRARDLAGVRLAVSAGGTREALDPVRHLTNASSGRMGLAIARAAPR